MAEKNELDMADYGELPRRNKMSVDRKSYYYSADASSQDRLLEVNMIF